MSSYFSISSEVSGLLIELRWTKIGSRAPGIQPETNKWIISNLCVWFSDERPGDEHASGKQREPENGQRINKRIERINSGSPAIHSAGSHLITAEQSRPDFCSSSSSIQRFIFSHLFAVFTDWLSQRNAIKLDSNLLEFVGALKMSLIDKRNSARNSDQRQES